MKSAKAEGLVLRAAIYARKSTNDGDRADELKSVKVQTENARRFATEHGFRVLDEHIYIDDNVSGARVSRPRFDAMLSALGVKDSGRRSSATALPFDVLIVRDQSRVIRNEDHAARLIKRIVHSGVQLWYYKERRRVELGSSERLMIGMNGQIDSAQREKASQDAREGLSERAQKGYNTGGCVYGYVNKPVMGEMASGQQQRLHTDFAIDAEQGEVIRRIFKMYAAGYGPRIIAKTLNGDPSYAALSRRFFSGERPPKPIVGKRGSGSWAPTAIRGMLRNERYAGVLVFGKWKNGYDEDGVKYREKQTSSSAIIRTERPDLRIVPVELWDAVQKRIGAERKSYLQSTNGQVHGRPETGRDSRYLLSGLVRCGGCGASMIASSQPHGSGEKRKSVACFVCSFRSNRGSTACTNALRPREEALTREVLAGIGDVLRPDVLRAAVRKAVQLRRERARAAEQSPERQRRALAKLEAERERLVSAVRMGGDRPLHVLVDALGACEAQLELLRRDVEQAARPAAVADLSEKRLEGRLLDLAQGWQGWIGKHPALARQALRAMLVGPIQLHVEPDGYRLKGMTRLGGLFAMNRVQMASPRGSALNAVEVPWERRVA